MSNDDDVLWSVEEDDEEYDSLIIEEEDEDEENDDEDDNDNVNVESPTYGHSGLSGSSPRRPRQEDDEDGDQDRGSATTLEVAISSYRKSIQRKPVSSDALALLILSMAEAIQALQDEQRRAAPPRAVDRDSSFETTIFSKLKEMDRQLTEIEKQLHDMETQRIDTYSIVDDIDKRLREAMLAISETVEHQRRILMDDVTSALSSMVSSNEASAKEQQPLVSESTSAVVPTGGNAVLGSSRKHSSLNLERALPAVLATAVTIVLIVSAFILLGGHL